MTLAMKKAMGMQVGSHVTNAERQAYLVRKVTRLASQVERGMPDSAEKRTVLAAPKVLLADEEDSDRKQWGLHLELHPIAGLGVSVRKPRPR
jgi:hypothetical protein